MARFVVVATGGAGGDLQPLIAASLALRDRGHDLLLIGDGSAARVVGRLGTEVEVLPPALDLGPRLAGAVKEAMTASGGDMKAAGSIVEARMAEWAREVGQAVAAIIVHRPGDAMVTSLFGVEVLKQAQPRCPWAVINSTFYIGPNPPRAVEEDIGPRALPLILRYRAMLDSADMVLHATDRVFDFSFDGLPPRHHYAGPLALWESPAAPPAYLDEPGDPWVLVTISSQLQDDIPLAQAALNALADKKVRVVLTVGQDHRPEEITARPANAHVEQNASHSAVLERGRLMISHAGHGSAMKALWAGRPMVLVPWGRDQPGVAARAQALGVAEIVARGEHAEADLAAAIDRVLGDSEMERKAAEHSARLHATDPPAVAAELLASLV
jgi:UDP:flavonoid glycosyltransferase YjiC (YdhE family)